MKGSKGTYDNRSVFVDALCSPTKSKELSQARYVRITNEYKNQRDVRQVYNIKAVSYTHLDVYKRQVSEFKTVLEIKTLQTIIYGTKSEKLSRIKKWQYKPCLLYTSRCV